MPIDTDTIARRALKSVKWVALSTIVSKSFQLIVLIVLARLLTPEDFGLVALATIVMTIINLFQDIGLRSALIQRKDPIDQAANLIFVSNIILGFFWCIGTYILAPYIASFFKNNNVIPVLRLMSLNFLIIPFTFVQTTFLARNLYFRKLFYLGLVPTLTSGITSIVFALFGFGVWALVYGNLTGNLLNAIVIWLFVRWRPTLKFSIKDLRELIAFGGPISLDRTVSWITDNVDHILVGKWFGIWTLGIYKMGVNFSKTASLTLTGELVRIIYPLFCRVQEDRKQLKKIYLRSIKYVSLITIPLGISFSLTAHRLIPILLGEKWKSLVPIIQILAPWGALLSICLITPQLCRALRKPELFLKLSTIRSIVSTPIYITIIPLGIEYLCLAQLFIMGVFLLINLQICKKLLGISTLEILEAFRLSLLSTLTISIAFFILNSSFLPFWISNESEMLIITFVTLIPIYLYSIFLISRPTFMEMKSILLNILR